MKSFATLFLPIFLTFQFLQLESQTLSVNGDFDNGRVQVISIDQVTRTIVTGVPVDNHTQNSKMRFWHYRIDGIVPGELITIQHQPSENIHYVYSYDGKEWFNFPSAGISNQKMRFVQSSVYIAPNIAYPYGRSLQLANEIKNSAFVQVSNLAISEEGRDIKLFRITDPAVSNNGKKVVWVMGRQHAFESTSSYIPEGFARWMISNDPAAAEFRKQVIAYVIPIMDVDNVYKGMSGKDQPNDFNRVWDMETPPWKAVKAAKNLLHSLYQQYTFLAFIDSHNPYYTETPHWHVKGSQENWNIFATAFKDGVTESGRANWNSTKANFNYNSDNLSIAAYYAHMNFSAAPNFLALTMETAHHNDNSGNFMLKEGVLQWGEAMGRALYKYNGGTIKPANIPPRASFTHNNGTFNASGSSAVNKAITEYRWDFGDGTIIKTQNHTIEYSYKKDGDYPVKLVVTDASGIQSAPFTMTVPFTFQNNSNILWQAETQQNANTWTNSGWSKYTFRVLKTYS